MREDGSQQCSVVGSVGTQRVICYDDFEGVFKWRIDGIWPLPGGASKSQTFVKSGNYALRLGRIGPPPDGLGWWRCYRSVGSVGFGIVTVHGSFYSDASAPSYGFGVSLEKNLGLQKRTFGIRYDGAMGRVQVYSEQGMGWRAEGDPLYLAFGAWHEIELKVDLVRSTYGRVSVDGWEFDASSLSGFSEVTTEKDGGTLALYVGLYSNVVRYVWADNVVVVLR